MQHLKCSSVFIVGVHELDVPLSFALKLLYETYLFKNKTKMFLFIYITRNKVWEPQVIYIQNIQGSLICLMFLSHSQVQLIKIAILHHHTFVCYI